MLAASLDGDPRRTRSTQITHLNAMRLFHYDPFSAHAREDCTVGALRARGADVDVSLQSSGKVTVRPDTPVRIIDLAAKATPKKAS